MIAEAASPNYQSLTTAKGVFPYFQTVFKNINVSSGVRYLEATKIFLA